MHTLSKSQSYQPWSHPCFCTRQASYNE